MYLMSINHYFEGGSWSDDHFKGVVRFKQRMERWLSEEGTDSIDFQGFEKRVIDYFESWKTNKVVSEWIIFYNTNKHLKLDPYWIAKIRRFFNVCF